MTYIQLENLKYALAKHKILTCIIYKNQESLFSYYSNQKMKKQLQTINSVTKTIIGLLFGMIIEEGLITDINTPIFNFFESYQHLFDDERKRRITLKHCLEMTDGFDWPEFGSWNSFAPMVFDSDIISFILKRKMMHEPGEVMNYNSGMSHLLGYIIQKTTNQSVHEYAKRNLFEPLNIKESKWYEKQGVSLGSDGLRLKTDDLVKIGQLFIGDYPQIISSNWINQMMSPNKKTYPKIGYYGYHLWIDQYKNLNYYFALGYGGQFLIIVPKYHLIIGITSRIYKDSLLPLNIVKKYIFDVLDSNYIN